MTRPEDMDIDSWSLRIIVLAGVTILIGLIGLIILVSWISFKFL